jgi:hypothetical protein
MGKKIDHDYIDVERKRADVSIDRSDMSDDGDEPLDRAAAAERNADTDVSFRFGRERGTLSASEVDEMIDESAVWDNDGRSQTRTGFDPRESDDPMKWRRLNKINDGWRASDRRQQNRWADRQRWIETFCSFLDLPQTDVSRVKHIMRDVDMARMGHYSSQQTILAIISLVANERGRWIRDEEDFRRLLQDTGTTLGEIKRVRQLVRQKTDKI